jgi:hypothetical protein
VKALGSDLPHLILHLALAMSGTSIVLHGIGFSVFELTHNFDNHDG